MPDHLDLALVDPSAAFRARYDAVAGGKVTSDDFLAKLPNGLALKFGLSLGGLALEDWEFLASIPRDPLSNPARVQYGIWVREHGDQRASELATVWTGTANASELLGLAAIQRRQEEAVAVHDGVTFERWAAVQQWYFEGGTGFVSTAGGHLGTRPFAGIETLVASMSPISEVLPYSRIATLRLPEDVSR